MAIEINGTTGISGVDGSAATPALQGQDTNTGISFGTDEVNVVTGGTTRTTVDSAGRLLVGTNNARIIGADWQVQVEGTTLANSGLSLVRNNNGVESASLAFGKSRSTSLGGSTSVNDGDQLGLISFYGADGTDIRSQSARIECRVNGTPGSNDMPGSLVFATTPDGAASSTDRLRITSDGTLQLRNSPGIDFSQIQTNAAGVISETLDSFEHGSWEARLRFGNTTEIGTYSTNSNAEYVKIGNIVHVSGATRYDSVNTSTIGFLTMDLPFAVDEHGQPHNWVYPGSAVISHSDLMAKGFHVLCGNAGAARSRFGFYKSTSGSIVYVDNADLPGWNGNTRFLHFNFSYQTNA